MWQQVSMNISTWQRFLASDRELSDWRRNQTAWLPDVVNSLLLHQLSFYIPAKTKITMNKTWSVYSHIDIICIFIYHTPYFTVLLEAHGVVESKHTVLLVLFNSNGTSISKKILLLNLCYFFVVRLLKFHSSRSRKFIRDKSWNIQLVSSNANPQAMQ